MSHYKPYPAYKNSGVEWLGRVPEHWEIVPLKYETDFVNGAAFKPEQWSEVGTPIIRIENLNGSLNFNCFDGEMDGRYHVEQGDLLFGWSGNRGTSFGPFIWPHEGRHYLNQHIFRVCDFKFDKSWFYWSLKAVTAHVEDQAHGIIGMVHITKGDLGSVKIATPELAEQQVISAHLDRETARIDALIEKKTHFIALLGEKRQALITDAVTKGLDASVKMKNCSVDWLGEVPEHWDCCLFKHKCLKVTDGAHISPDTVNGVYYFVSTKDIVDERIDFAGALLTSSDSYEYLVRTGCNPLEGDVLFSKDGTVGRTVVVRDAPDFVVASSLIIIRPEPCSLDSVYFNYFCQSKVVASQVESLVRGAGLPRISIQNLLKIIGVFPPLAEQRVVVGFLDTEISRIDSLIRKTDRSIDLLKERRSALITAAVTGQIDLREAV